ncbi:MAG: RnfABCDGE type electron transport complex subunit B [Atopobiaceae bacterium]|nr:RnfABCDGE type electron transport complex subunit B [Atopobiaceae bacterium]MBQ3283318.1 RnfABCDGE type electron transport complex subunit B [Atopobiaceae bacterium]
MNSIILTIALIATIGLVGSIILVVGSRAFAVEEDERLPELVAILPGANCGSCGYPGCEGYAKAMLDGAACNACGPGGAAVAKQLSEYLGVDAGDVAVKRAIVACRGAKDRLVMKERETYEGAPSCRVFATMNHLSNSCTDGCIGFGDCVATCPYGALSLNENSVAVVDPSLCVGCGLCTEVCPRHLISLQAKNHVDAVSFVLCHSTLMGKKAKEACANTCLGCRKCVKACPNGCITVENNVAHVDITNCIGCGKCREACPVGALNPMAWVDKQEG